MPKSEVKNHRKAEKSPTKKSHFPFFKKIFWFYGFFFAFLTFFLGWFLGLESHKKTQDRLRTPKKPDLPGNRSAGSGAMASLQFLALLALGAGISGILGITEASPEEKSPEELPAPAWLQPRSPGSPPAPSWLLWVPFRGRLPADAVSSWNRRSGRPEFVCSARTLYGCNLGSFDPARGAFCSYAWAEHELRSHSFHLLVNPSGFEALDWVDTSFGSAPEGAVEGCPLIDLFVGRSADGLGKASKEQQALFVAVDGEEVWYKWYQVLVVRQGPADISIANVSYNGSAALDSAESVELAEVLARNDGCEAATKSVSLEEETEVEHGWSTELPALAAANGLLQAAPVVFTESGGWDLGKVITVPWAGAASAGEFVSRLHRISEEIPARSECAVVLRGLRREIRVPFSAWLTREFRSGRPHRALVAGWAQTRAVTGVHAGLERCRRLTELPPCPN